MTNFIFKSSGLIKNVYIKLEIIQSELRHQRSDNVQILFLLNKLLTNKKLQTQVDDFYTENVEPKLDAYESYKPTDSPTTHPRDE